MHHFVKSYYSLRFGTIPVDELPLMGVSHSHMVLADINSTAGMVDFVIACRKQNIHPVAGVEFRNEDTWTFTGVALNNEGFRELNELLSEYNLSGQQYPRVAPDFSHVWVIYPESYSGRLRDNEFIGLSRFNTDLFQFQQLPMPVTKYVFYDPVACRDDAEYDLHRYLRAVHHNILLSRLTPSMLCTPVYPQIPLSVKHGIAQTIVETTERLVAQCSIRFDLDSVKNKKMFTDSHGSDLDLIRQLAEQGCVKRYGKHNFGALKRLYHELAIIEEKGFSSYFLIAWDIVRYARHKGYYHVGRGSGANSLVAYALRITDVDPIDLNLYFERFLNPRRSNPPDFDIDFSWRDRDDVLNYIFSKYGRKHTALLGSMSTFKGRSVIRELAKTVGLPKSEIDLLVDEPSHALNRDGLKADIVRMAGRLSGYPNIHSIHAGGVLISEEPITTYTALHLPPKSMPVTQFDMYVAEDLRFEKFDILSQRGIGHIQDAVKLIHGRTGENVNFHDVERFKSDVKVKALLKSGETLGCFYAESPGMRSLLKKLRCSDYLGLVAASSVIRPGVSTSGMMREYIKRFNNPGSFEYIHPIIEEILHETFGIMIYQEDVLKVCHYFAGLDLGDADILRRAMNGKYRSRHEFDNIVQKFFANCRKRGYPEEVTQEVWRQIQSFSSFSFNKAHSASYAVESFQSMFLKVYYPLEFITAVINNFGGFYSRWVYFLEARKLGATVELPCVNHSSYLTSLHGNSVYMGFIHVNGFEQQLAERIAKARDDRPFADLSDFLARVNPGLEQLKILIRIAALRFTGMSKQQLMWQVHMEQSQAKIQETRLFEAQRKQFQLPALETSSLEDAFDELELLDFTVTMSQFDMLKTGFRGQLLTADFMDHVGKTVKLLGLLVTIKYVRTRNGESMNMATFSDYAGDFFDTVHFPDSIRAYPFRGNGIYLILGRITEEFGYPTVEVFKMTRMPLQSDPRYA